MASCIEILAPKKGHGLSALSVLPCKAQCSLHKGLSMNYAADDFDFIRKRVEELKRGPYKQAPPPYKSGSSQPGFHCDYCPLPPDGTCALACGVQYKEKYGIDPYQEAA